MRAPQLLASGTASINMTPMIDVVFLLIIFFLVSSHLAKQENSLKLDLPEAVSALDEESAREIMVVNVLPDGSWKLAGVELNEDALLAAMKRRVREVGGDLNLKIRTDRSVKYRRLEPILEAATEAGVGNIGFSVFEDR